MTRLIETDDLVRLVGRVGVVPLLARLHDYLRDDFARWPEFEKSARLASHSKDGVIELMPTSDGSSFAFKYVNGHPVNPARGKLTVTAFGVLADVETGYPLLISEMTLLTAIRTAATSALAAGLMSRRPADTMALIGAGAQAEFQALAFHGILGVNTLRVFDPDGAAVAKLARNLRYFPAIRCIPCHDAAECCDGAQIVTTATAAKTRARVVDRGMLARGAHVNAIGGDCPGKTELDPRILEEARVVVEYLPQSRVEGEIQSMPEDYAATELWRVVAGLEAGRRDDEEITVFDSVGFAVEDFSTLRLVADLCEEHGIGRRASITPDLEDPKDLFRVLRDVAAGPEGAGGRVGLRRGGAAG